MTKQRLIRGETSEDIHERWKRKRKFRNRDGTESASNMFRKHASDKKRTVTKRDAETSERMRNISEDVLEKVETKNASFQNRDGSDSASNMYC